MKAEESSMSQPEVILLTDTNLFGEFGSGRYMGAYVLASQLRKAGYEVVVIDYFTQNTNFFEYIEKFLSEKLLFVGIASTFLAPSKSINQKNSNRTSGLNHFYSGELWLDNGDSLLAWSERLKQKMQKKSPDSKLIIGGTKAQFAIWRKQYYSYFDYVCLGSADQAIVNFAESLKNKSPVKTKDVNGTLIIDNSVDIQNKLCPDTIWEKNFGVLRKESLPIEISRGCVFNCKFCHYDKKESYKKNLEILKNELLRNYENYGTDTYHFCDDCFNDHPQKVEDTCSLFLNLPFKIEWVSYARVDVAVKFPETMRMMIESGAKGLYFGLESFNQSVAIKAGKGTPTDKVKSFLLDFHKKYSNDCLLEGSFIVGLPGETVESQKETARWIMENPVLDFLTIGPLGIMPYVQSFDKILFDYAEYSRNPEKYGFTEIDYNKRFWSHETFNSITADAMATQIKSEWNKIKNIQKIKTIWLYPHLKSLGYSKEQIFSLAKDANFCEKFDSKDIVSRFESFKNHYWQGLKQQIQV